MKTKIKYQINEKIILKKRDEKFQKQDKISLIFTELRRSYVGLENKLKAMEENFENN